MRLRALSLVALAVLLLCGGAPTSRADEPLAGSKPANTREQVMVEMLAILKLQMEARMHEGELLAKAGRLEEALDAYRSVGAMSKTGLANLEARLARLAAPRVGLRSESGRVPAARAPTRREPPRVLELENPEDPGLVRVGWEAIGGSQSAFRFRGGAAAAGRAPRWKHEAVDDALRWLRAHQSPNGSWEAAGFFRWCDGKPAAAASRRPDGLGKALYTDGVTGLALTAFLTAGYTHRGKHPFAKGVAKGLRYLRAIQDPEGCFGTRRTQQYIYNHMICSLAMVEAYGMTGSPLFKASAQRALDFIAVSRNPYFAWRYGIKPGDNDTSVTMWAVHVLKSATMINAHAVKAGREAPFTVDVTAFDGVRAWLGKVTDPDYGRVGYVQRGTGPARPVEMIDRFPSEKSESMTAAGILMRVLTGEDPSRSKPIKLGTTLCLELPPAWNPADGSIDMIYWFSGTLAMYQVGGRAWAAWDAQLKSALGETQRKDGDFCGTKGSWDPIGPWGADGGRVYSTALMALTLSAELRTPRVFEPKGK